MSYLYRCVAVVSLILLFPAVLMAQDAPSTTNTHVVQPGETLFRIALRYGLTTSELAASNSIGDVTRIYVGQVLLIPGEVLVAPVDVPAVAPQTTTAASDTDLTATAPPEAVPALPATSDYVVRRGDSLRAIALQYGTSEAELIALNGITNPDRILVGQVLRVPGVVVVSSVVEPAAVAEVIAASAETVIATVSSAPVETITHTVQQGEYLSAIARRYGVTTNLLIAANNLTNPNQLFAGQTLLIPTSADIEALNAILYPEPAPVYRTGREIVVDLSNSSVYAYEDGVLVYEVLGSTGLPATPTVQGSFTVRTKVRAQTMSGPGYWLPNVEWVMYFYQGYALHGAYWHNNFGQPMSHGCVNLTNEDARWLYEWAEVGTPVTVQA
jgi:LysM repeat protein